jgi:hypothetical protein
MNLAGQRAEGFARHGAPRLAGFQPNPAFGAMPK